MADELLVSEPNTRATLTEWTPLHWAVRPMQVQRIDLACLLIEHGTDATAKTTRGWTLLDSAAWRGREDLECLLIEYGADPTAR